MRTSENPLHTKFARPRSGGLCPQGGVIPAAGIIGFLCTSDDKHVVLYIRTAGTDKAALTRGSSAAHKQYKGRGYADFREPPHHEVRSAPVRGARPARGRHSGAGYYAEVARTFGPAAATVRRRRPGAAPPGPFPGPPPLTSFGTGPPETSYPTRLV
jgi:hypothetical protein